MVLNFTKKSWCHYSFNALSFNTFLPSSSLFLFSIPYASTVRFPSARFFSFIFLELIRFQDVCIGRIKIGENLLFSLFKVNTSSPTEEFKKIFKTG